ncbi:MAG: flagellar basal body P-ring protein FlgI [Calditrichia bacterium]
MKKFLLILIVIYFSTTTFGQVRIKDITQIKGVNETNLIGYGIVVGLNGTGDSRRTQFTIQSVANMLERFGVKVDQNQMRLKNVAAVMVTATASNLLKNGDRIDVQVSSMGDAKSLEGGTLLMTPLADQQGNVLAIAQGPISVGGFNQPTTLGGGVRQNYTTTGRIPGGGLLQASPGNPWNPGATIYLALKDPDFTTVSNIVVAINAQFGDSTAIVQDPSTILLNVPQGEGTPNDLYAFISTVENIQVTPDVEARVVINERTGTVVVGGNVTILPVAIAHGNLSIEITSQPIVSQPNAFSQGQTVVVPNTQATVYQDNNQMVTINGASTVQQVAQALNSLGLTPRDIIAVLQALKQSGALKAELVIM